MKIQDNFWYTRYKNLRDDLKSIIDRNKKSYLKEYFHKHAKNSNETWKKLTKLLIIRNQIAITYTYEKMKYYSQIQNKWPISLIITL